jgi:hypothetical protein
MQISAYMDKTQGRTGKEFESAQITCLGAGDLGCFYKLTVCALQGDTDRE